MSDQEFERYIAILSGLLKLDKRRRDEIAAELRDHLEERLDELLAAGRTRHQAILMALEEFGDAAGLAGEFVQIFRRERRRRVMKMTMTSVAVCLVVTLITVAMWPENSPAPVIRQVSAQDQESKKELKTQKEEPAGKPAVVDLVDDNNAITEAKLAKRLEAKYLDIPLSDVLQAFSELYDVELFINHKRIEDLGNDLRSPNFNVNLELKSVRGDMLLDLLLRDAQLVYTIRDGIIVITTEDDLESTLEVRVYNCRDLVSLTQVPSPGMMGEAGMDGAAGMMMGMPAGAEGMPGMGAPAGAGMPSYSGSMMGGMGGAGIMPGMPGMSSEPPSKIPHLDALIDVITSTVMPDSWAAAGGPGTIQPYYGGLLIVNTNPQAHRRIEKLLKMMRDASQQQPGSVVRD